MSRGRAAPPARITVDEFLAWADAQPENWELFDGEPVAMAPERYLHAGLKGRIYRHLAEAIERAGLACEAMVEGMGVRVSPDSFYQPDVFVRCGPPPADDAIEIADPIIVIEIASPSTAWRDENVKLYRYMEMPSVRHVLMVVPSQRRIGHHERRDDGAFLTRIWGSHPIRLDPPGIVLPPIF